MVTKIGFTAFCLSDFHTLLDREVSMSTLLQSERPKLHRVLAALSPIGLKFQDNRFYDHYSTFKLNSTCIILYGRSEVPKYWDTQK